MERGDAILLFDDAKFYINKFLEEIRKDNVNKLVFKGTPSVKLYDVAKDVAKVAKYVFDGKAGADRLKSELLSLRELAKELQRETSQKGYSHFSDECGMIIDIIDNMERWESDTIQETNQSEIIPETGDNEGLSNKGNNKPMNEAQVMMSVKKIEPFEPLKNGKPIPYKKCFERLTEGKIRRSAGESEPVEVINKQYSLKLFQYCVDRADISKIYKLGKKSYARLFMNDMASFYEDSSAYRKAAARAFNVTKLGVGTKNTGINADYYNLMTGIFSKDVNYQKVKKKK